MSIQRSQSEWVPDGGGIDRDDAFTHSFNDPVQSQINMLAEQVDFLHTAARRNAQGFALLVVMNVTTVALVALALSSQ